MMKTQPCLYLSLIFLTSIHAAAQEASLDCPTLVRSLTEEAASGREASHIWLEHTATVLPAAGLGAAMGGQLGKAISENASPGSRMASMGQVLRELFQMRHSDKQNAENIAKLSALQKTQAYKYLEMQGLVDRAGVQVVLDKAQKRQQRSARLKGAGPGAIAGALAGAALKPAVLVEKCGHGLTYDQAMKINSYFQAALMNVNGRGLCRLQPGAAEELQSLDDKKLAQLCKDVPQLPVLLSDHVDQQRKEMDQFPKIQSLSAPSCDGTQSSITAVMADGRRHSWRWTEIAEGSRYQLKAVISPPEGKEGQPVEYTADVDSSNQSMGTLSSSNLVTSALGVSQLRTKEITNSYYRHGGQLPGDLFQRQHYYAGESLVLAGGLRQMMKYACDATGAASGDTPAEANPAVN